MDIGSVLGRSVAIYTKNFMSFTILSVVSLSPVFICFIIATSGDFNYYVQQGIQMIMIGSVLSIPLSLVAAGTITYGVVQELTGHHVRLGESISFGISRLVPALITGLLVGLVIIGGMICLIIPGLIFMAKYSMAVPIAIVEGKGAVESLKQSDRLTSGHKWMIFGFVFIIGVMEKVSEKVIQATINVDIFNKSTLMDDLQTQLMFIFTATILFSTWRAVAIAVAYNDLRVSKDGITSKEIAETFA